MSRFLKSLFVFSAAVPLASCSVFYPNWGATGLPDEEIPVNPTATVSPSASESTSEQPTESPSTSTSPSPSETETTAPKAKVSVEILFAMADSETGVLEVVAQVPNLSEQTGECVLTLTGPTSISSTVSAEQSSNFMQCTPFDIELSRLAPGSYSAVVEYDSTGHFGSSQPYPIEVQ